MAWSKWQNKIVGLLPALPGRRGFPRFRFRYAVSSETFERLSLEYALREAQDFDPNDLLLLVKIEHHARGDLLGIHNFRFVQSQVERVGFAVDFESHNFFSPQS